LQKHISARLRQKDSLTSLDKVSENDDNPGSLLKVGYRISSQELKEQLFQFLTAEELAELAGRNLDNLPALPKQ
jgi:hypothetical protein